MDFKKLCIAMIKSESENEIISLLKEYNLWDNPKAWKYYGNNENNFAVIGNQQSTPDSALVEKIVNSVDAVLMRECLRKGIDPESKNAPLTIENALERFFNINHGILTNLTTKDRKELSKNIIVVATGSKSHPNYEIIDKGEGQTPAKMPETFLSLTKSNKLRIPFVQGKFNMGGTGALQFCGKHNLQLIVSKRDPLIAKHENNDDTKEYWGFTLVRRVNPENGMKSSTFKYLVVNNKIPIFKADTLNILPDNYPIAYKNPLSWGTLIKLYEYQLTGGLKTAIYFDLYYRLSTLLPNIALPILLSERREGYKAQSYDIVLSGLNVRLEEDKSKNIEEGFPSSATIKIKGQEMKIQIFVFRPGKETHYKRKKEGIIFTINGQAHGFISESFFTRKSVGMSYLAKSLLVIANCTKFDGRTREDLFMNSRDRLREGELKKGIEEALSDLLRKHQGLRELKEQRRKEEIKDKLENAKPLVEVIEKVIKNSPALTTLFIKGNKVKNPFNLIHTGSEGSRFVGKKFPTYFKLKKEFPQTRPKHCPINQRFRIQFETDATNNYFTRDTDPGEIKLSIRYDKYKDTIDDYTLNIWNGIVNITISLPKWAKENYLLEYKTEVNDISRVSPFVNTFHVLVESPINKKTGKKTKRINPPGGKGNKRESPSEFNLPNIIEVKKEDWSRYGFDKKSALKVIDSGEEGYDFYINIDNVYLLSEIKERTNTDPDILRSQYKNSLILIGMSLLKELKEQENESIYEKIENITKAISPVLLPMINSLGTLEQ